MARASIGLDVRAANADPLDLDAYFAVARFGNLRIAERKPPRLVENCNPLGPGMGRVYKRH
jgi:hypothetical protein